MRFSSRTPPNPPGFPTPYQALAWVTHVIDPLIRELEHPLKHQFVPGGTLSARLSPEARPLLAQLQRYFYPADYLVKQFDGSEEKDPRKVLLLLKGLRGYLEEIEKKA